MGRLRPLLRLSVVLLLLSTIVAFEACDDDREPIVGPNPRMLDGDDVFAIMQISAGILRFQNVIADTVLRYLELTSSDTLVTIVGDTPAGLMEILIDGDGIGGNPDTALVAFINFRDTTSVPLAEFISGYLKYAFTKTENGLVYEINPGEADSVRLGILNYGAEYSLSSEANSMVLLASGSLHAEMPAGTSSSQSGTVRQTGSCRIEDRDQRAAIVLELDVTYDYDEDALPAFEDWPGGSLEFGGFLGGSTLQPFDVTLDGLGGATFHYGDHLCITDMALDINPCEDLGGFQGPQ